MTNILNQYIFSRGYFVLLISLFYGCNLSNPSGDTIVKSPDDESFIPNSVWVSDAESWFDISQRLDSSYTLYASLNKPTEDEIKMLFGSDRNLYSLEILGDANLSYQLYFENGKIAFSHHIDKSAQIEWLIAYANEKAYAAAVKKKSSDWTAIHPTDIPIDHNLIQLAEAKAKPYQEKEKRHSYTYRIRKNTEMIHGKFESDLSLTFSMNVRKGETIDLSLESTNKTIYFVVSPNNGSNMEHREWRGSATTTGDLKISVFSVESDTDQGFTLNVRNVSPQTLASAPAH